MTLVTDLERSLYIDLTCGSFADDAVVVHRDPEFISAWRHLATESELAGIHHVLFPRSQCLYVPNRDAELIHGIELVGR